MRCLRFDHTKPSAKRRSRYADFVAALTHGKMPKQATRKSPYVPKLDKDWSTEQKPPPCLSVTRETEDIEPYVRALTPATRRPSTFETPRGVRSALVLLT
ncbi:hypothetical protein EVAR_50334_1 [Eumeta japonica]|uniref:Uncharacterized protein n=1 Tax=Eumeta variegata TaxID=151549 RepID=A0A4C1XMZ4_EUMVA|nr:hypothetical protein EVAR_50334_1 [Eumeta japonica]